MLTFYLEKSINLPIFEISLLLSFLVKSFINSFDYILQLNTKKQLNS